MTQLKKALNDLWLYKSRSFIVIFAIVLGVAGLGTVITAYSILRTDLNANFLNTHPASATLVTEKALDRQLVQKIRQRPDIEEAELRKIISVRIQVRQKKWIPLLLFVVNDFNNLRIATFTLKSGKMPGLNEMLIERDSEMFLRSVNYNKVNIQLKDGTQLIWGISGKVHDPGQAPARMERVVYGYISKETYAKITKKPLLNRLQLRVVQNKLDKQHIAEVVAKLGTMLTKSGNPVLYSYIPEPEQHPHQWQLNALLILIGSIGLLAFALSGVLVANIVSFLISQQIQQIGVMKAIGATKFQLMKIYYFIVLTLGTIALIFAIPLSISSGKMFSQFTAMQLNFDIFTQSPPFWVYLVLVSIGLLFPLLVATIPILKGCQISVREALNYYGLADSRSQMRSFINRLNFLSATTKLSVRNTFRQKWRPVLTIGTLTLGFALYMVSLNVRESLSYLLQQSSDSKKYDMSYRLGQFYDQNKLGKAIASIGGIEKVAFWKTTKAKIVLPNRSTSNNIKVVVPKVKDKILDLELVKGHWLNNGSPHQLVINGRLQLLYPHLKVGSKVNLLMNNQTVSFTITGLVKEFQGETFYMSNDTYSQLFGKTDLANQVFLVLKNQTKGTSGGMQSLMNQVHGTSIENNQRKELASLNRQIESQWQAAGVQVVGASVKKDELRMVEAHLDILTFMVLFGAILALVVGALSLILTINLNIVERTREIGVMRAIGASTNTIFKMIFTENLIIGVISVIIGFVLSLPLGVMITNFLGNLIFETPLDYKISIPGSLSVILIMLIFIRIAIALPRRKIKKVAIREALVFN